MNKNKDKNEDEVPPSHYKFYLGSRERYIHLSSNFEAGSIQLVRQMSEFNYRLSCIDDGVKTGHRVNSKSWFYFRVHGFPKNTKGKFTVSRVQTLMAVYTHHPKSYRPVFRERWTSTSLWSEWSRIPTESPLVLRQNGELEVTFEFLFKNQAHEAQFAFAFPYSYTRNSEYLNSLNEYYCHQQFYFHKEILAYSPEQRNVHLLTITSHDQATEEHEAIFNEALFPEKCRPKKFTKPVILISARVHPAQTAASFAMEGVIDFLINNKDVRSYLLKKMFVFMIVPMINVDGVYHGHFRMDSFGKNLNRYYLDPSLEKQPAVFAIKELASHLVKHNRLSFYFDLHAHNAKKGAFIYGNAINDFVEQVESQVFCKLFALNHSGFEYDYCNFSQKQMNSKDRNEERTKEGCGRVVMHRLANIVHSYSLECGIISASKPNTVPEPMNGEFKLNEKCLLERPQSEVNHEGQFFTQESYRQLGKSMLVSVLDVFDKNPYNRVYNSQHKSLQFLRRVTAFEVFHQAQRFRMFEKYVYGKVKNINELIREVLNSKLHYRQLYNFYFYNDNQLKTTEWPQNIPGLVKPKFTKKLRRFHSLQEPKLEYSLSFMQDLKMNKDQLDQGITQANTPTFNTNTVLLNSLPELNEVVLEKEGQEGESGSSETENEEEVEEKRSDQKFFYEKMMEQDQEIHSETFIPYGKQSLKENYPIQEVSRWSTYNQKGSEPWITEKELCLSEKDGQEQEEREETTEENQINFYNIDEVKKLTRLKFFEKSQANIKSSNNQSPSMRVRKMMKNEAQRKIKLTNKEMKEKLNQMITNSPQISNNSFAAGHPISNYSGLSAKPEKQVSEVPFHERQLRLFQEIKHEIKQELKRHKERNSIITAGRSKMQKYSISEVKDKERIRSTNVGLSNLTINAQQSNHFHQKQKSQTLNRQPSKSLVGKTQLPALNSHVLIISSSSSKGLNRS